MNMIILAFEFCKIGLFAVGGGLATLPFLYQIAGKYFWLDAKDIPNMLAVAQLLPGAIGINLAAYTGTHTSTLGGCIAVLSMITPQIAVITLIARAFESFNQNTIVQKIFNGLSPAATGLLCAAAFRVIKLPLYRADAAAWYHAINMRETLIFITLFVLIRLLKKLHPAAFLAAAGITGALLKL